jgi:hypothetical protein
MQWLLVAAGMGLGLLGVVGVVKTCIAAISARDRAGLARLPVAPEGDFTLPAAGDYRVELEHPRFVSRPLKRSFGGHPLLTARDLSSEEVVAVTPPPFWWPRSHGLTRSRHPLGRLRVARGGPYRLLCAVRGEATEAIAREGFHLIVTRPYAAKFVGLILGCNVAGWALAGGIILLVQAYSRIAAPP